MTEEIHGHFSVILIIYRSNDIDVAMIGACNRKVTIS